VKAIRLVQLSPAVFSALADGDLPAANRIADLRMSAYFVGPQSRSTWRRRAMQAGDDPASIPWLTRAVLDVESGLVVGRAGFHGPPDADDVVELGYAIDPAFRRQGFARAALSALLSWARSDPCISKVRASVRPDNVPSMALVESFGFIAVGDRWDDEDGLEVILEWSVR
jgi:RimJ/RimL family protein N-acetyltransferase